MPDKRVIDKLLPISWDGWDQGDTLSFNYYNVIFRSDFGCFIKGDVIPVLWVDFENGSVEETDDKGVVIRTQKIKVVAK